MKIHEYQAKDLFKQYEIPVLRGWVADTPAAAKKSAAQASGLVAVKAQVHAGGRGKAGGIKLARTPDEAEQHASKILGMNIKGSIVRKLLIEEGAQIAKEYYFAITVDRSSKSILFICSAEGGIEIEEVAEKSPEKILKFNTITKTFPEQEAQKYAKQLFSNPSVAEQAVVVMRKLFKLFVEKDCSLAEINPLVVTKDDKIIALDGKINFDDNALFRHPDVVALRDMGEENPNEIMAKEKGLSFIQLDGDIGCMVNGAGLAMATMDMVKLFGGNPANFLDVGGSSNPEKVIHAFKLILASGKIKSILINIFGGITRCDDIAKGILASYQQIEINVPIVVRLIGTNAEQGLKLLEGSPLIPAATFAEAVKKAIEASGGPVLENEDEHTD